MPTFQLCSTVNSPAALRSVQRQRGEYNQMAIMGKGDLFEMRNAPDAILDGKLTTFLGLAILTVES